MNQIKNILKTGLFINLLLAPTNSNYKTQEYKQETVVINTQNKVSIIPFELDINKLCLEKIGLIEINPNKLLSGLEELCKELKNNLNLSQGIITQTLLYDTTNQIQINKKQIYKI